MFTIDQIRAAHLKVKSGADFPKYINELRELGVTRYINYVSDGHTDYEGTNSVSGPPKYEKKLIGEKSNTEELNVALKVHQSGGTDYPTFCSQAAECGVDAWVVDIDQMTCTYVDKNNKAIVIERIPG